MNSSASTAGPLDHSASPVARFKRQQTTIGAQGAARAPVAGTFQRSNTKAVTSNSKKGKKGAAPAKPDLGGFSLTPYHEQLLAANASSSEEESEDYLASDGDTSNDSYWFTSSDEDEEEGELDEEDIKYKASRMVMYALHTHYDVIKEVAKFNFEYHLTKR